MAANQLADADPSRTSRRSLYGHHAPRLTSASGIRAVKRTKKVMKYLSKSFLAVLIACASASIAQNAIGQDSRSVPPPADGLISTANPALTAPTCELHVFPTKAIYADGRSGLDAAISGVPMGLVVAAAAGAAVAAIDQGTYGSTTIAADKQLHADLSPENQIEVLRKIDLIRVLKLEQNTKIVWELAPITESEAKDNPSLDIEFKRMRDNLNNKTRMSSSMAACYTELVVKAIGFHMIGTGSQLNSFFEIRKFWGKQKTDDYINDTFFGVSPQNFPAKKPEQELAAVDGVHAAFAKDFTDWAARMIK